MARTLDITVAVVSLFGALATVVPSAAAIECTCRAPGKRVELGGTICLRTPDGPRLARCVMDLNITSWKVLDAPCPTAALPDPAPMSRIAVLLPSAAAPAR